MLQPRVARAYARALFDVSRQQDCLDPVRQDMAGIAGAVHDSPQLARVLRDYAIGRQVRAQILERCFRSGAHALTWRFLCMLEERRRLGILEAVCQAFHDRCREAAGVRDARLVSSAPLGAELLAALEARIRTRMKTPVELTVAVNPALGGGFTLQVDDTLYDWSVAGALRGLRRALATA